MAEIGDILIAARIARPYYARAMAALTPVARPGLGTVAVDKYWRLYYDMEWLNTLPIAMAGLVIAAHEVEHLLRDHAGRCEMISASPRAWNVAGDAEINDDLALTDLPAGHIRPADLNMADGLLAEEYYDACGKNHAPSCGGGSGSGRPIDGELPGAAGDVDAVGAERIRDGVASDVRDFAASHGRGSVPAHALMWAEERAKTPVYSWRKKLSSVVAARTRRMSQGRHDYTWSRLSRRSSDSVFLPGKKKYRPRVHIVVDTSGSMAGAGKDVLGHVLSITAHSDVSIFECDSEFRKIKKREAKELKFTGGGGTDLRGAIMAADKKCDLLVIVTDCDTPWDGAPKSKCVIVRIGNSDWPQWPAERVQA